MIFDHTLIGRDVLDERGIVIGKVTGVLPDKMIRVVTIPTPPAPVNYYNEKQLAARKLTISEAVAHRETAAQSSRPHIAAKQTTTTRGET